MQLGFVAAEERGRRLERNAVNEACASAVRREQGFDFAPQRAITITGFIKKGMPLFRVKPNRSLKDLIDLLITLRSHCHTTAKTKLLLCIARTRCEFSQTNV
jgi:hypothetical protein